MTYLERMAWDVALAGVCAVFFAIARAGFVLKHCQHHLARARIRFQL